MNPLETYLINNGIRFQTAGKYGRMVDKYLDWLKENNLTPAKVKRSRFTDYLQHCKERGDAEKTIKAKEGAIKHYYDFLGTKHNPAKRWIKQRKQHTLPPKPIEKEELLEIYKSITPKSPADFRDRCMLGFVLFQGFLRSDLMELRVSDVDFEGKVFVQGQTRTNSRTLKLEPFQLMHLYDYFNKYRKHFLAYKTHETDKFFLSIGTGSRLDNAVSLLWNKIKSKFPHVENFQHLRGSVIAHWDKEEGIIEAMTKAGHRYVSSTQRFQTGKLEELQEELKTLHPMEYLDLSSS